MGDGTGSSSENINKLLAIAASAVVILAFFGIATYHDLEHALFGGSATGSSSSAAAGDTSACDLAIQAQKYRNGHILGADDATSSAIYQAYSAALSNAAATTAAGTLQADLHNAAYAANELGATYARGGNEWTWLNELTSADMTWSTYCWGHGVRG